MKIKWPPKLLKNQKSQPPDFRETGFFKTGIKNYRKINFSLSGPVETMRIGTPSSSSKKRM